MKSHCDVGVLFISSSPDLTMPVKEEQIESEYGLI